LRSMHHQIAAPVFRLLAWLPLFLLVACSEEPSFDASLLAGSWELNVAYRNGEPTTSLEGLYFDFDGQDKLSTNLTGIDRVDNYVVDGDRILQSGGPMSVNYKIEELTDQRLVLSTTLRNYDFRFVLLRPTEEGTE
ncbi:MAG: lipocalin family protein, partial [Lewinella sp.]|nr:lipocalin family protein [Lewinella sp.]